ncbi:hypothetical protein RvY_12165 [Ramazzottius varieornatus]|uniref:WD repeat-containing protein 74 n=1 Tax=Ramazzottius varieornatus TaxID=947166 RepID=A0A1D1VIJ1_RAMVA|nr:hypothetical protein RvY_12165 [Ramazzottius varieornatus]
MDSVHVLVGCETGLLKAVNIPSRAFTNIATDSSSLVNKERAVDIILFDQTEDGAEHDDSLKVRLGLRNRDFVCLDVRNPGQHFSKLRTEGGDGNFVGGGMIGDNMTTCVQSGHIFRNERMQRSKQISSCGSDVCQMTQGLSHPSTFVTGGRENLLKVWDFSNASTPIFTAKNLPDDKLRLRVKTWINDLKFRPKSDDKVVLAVTAYHELQVFDVRAKRRPTMIVNYSEDPLTCLDINPQKEFEVLVANRLGKVALFDLRGTKGMVLRAFTGNQGSVRDIQFHPSESDHFAVCGLDRFLRLYKTSQKTFVSEIYMKSVPTCLRFTNEAVRIWSRDDQLDAEERLAEEKEGKATKKRKIVEEEEVIEDESIWTEMSTVDESGNDQEEAARAETAVLPGRKKKQR